VTKSFKKFSQRLFLMILAGAILLVNHAAAQSSAPVLGSSNTVTADPLVPRPSTTPCIVPLFTNFEFDNFNNQTFTYTPPAACPGPWAKVVFTADFNVTAGIQFDRTAAIYLGHANIYYGTTAEPAPNLAPSWHVERDLTDYSALFKSSQTGEVDLGNLVNSTYTGIIFGSATVELYPADHGAPAPATPEAVFPMPDANGGAQALFTTTDQLTQTFTLPTNIERAYLDVIAQSQSNDEFWYTCAPNDVAAEVESCGNTAFRETEVSIDGQPAGVAPVYPWIFTGGIDTSLWVPIPGVQTLNFVPYRVDLTPFSGVLSDGQPHTVAVSVYNADSYFLATASLLVYLDHGSMQVTGAVTQNTIAAAPSPAVTENLQTDAEGDVTGSVVVGSSRQLVVAGYVNTSHGIVSTQVAQNVNFLNTQQYTINASAFDEDLNQSTTVDSTTTTKDGNTVQSTIEHFSHPLKLFFNENVQANGDITLATSVRQIFDQNETQKLGSAVIFQSAVNNQVQTQDTEVFDGSFNFLGTTGTQSSQTYTASNSLGYSYSCTLASALNVLTSVQGNCGN
jgi:Peptide N-acetyl-beta-D-glucosaminyl asparaginase amidase A